jgi:hypothetical protein
LVVVVGASLAAWACGGNGADGGDSPPEIETFCDQSVALDELRRAPTDAELDNLLDNAPEGILAEVEILVSSAREFREGNEEAADSPEIQRAGRRFDAFVEKNCT